MSASDDPIDMLVEIAQVTMARMNKGNPRPEEAFTLGTIMGITNRRREVIARLIEEDEHAFRLGGDFNGWTPIQRHEG